MIAKKMKEMQEKYNEMVLLYDQQQVYLSELKTSIDKILGGIETLDLILKEAKNDQVLSSILAAGPGNGAGPGIDGNSGA